MSYGHAERNLALIRQLEAETRQLPGKIAATLKNLEDVEDLRDLTDLLVTPSSRTPSLSGT